MNHRAVIMAVILFLGLAVLIFSISDDQATKKGIKAVAGLEAPPLFLEDTAGKRLSENDLKGTVLFINFWASWCKPCREEMPSIQALYNQVRADKRIRFIMVLYKDDVEKAMKYLKENNLDLPVYIDINAKTASNYGITGVPETYLVGKNGIISQKIIGPADWSSNKAIAAVTGLINEAQ